MRAIILADLDDSLFQTLRKCPRDMDHALLTPLAWGEDGAPMSYATPAQMALIDGLLDGSVFLPVTARSLAALRRVKLPFTSAICAHGGIILGDDGQPDAAWHGMMVAAVASFASPLAEYEAALRARGDARLAVRIIMEGELPLYLLVRHLDQDIAALNRAVDEAIGKVPPGWTDHRNDNVIALLPPFLGKEKAVAHLLPSLRAAHPGMPVIGIGDSISDGPFMALCDYAITPAISQLARKRLLG